MLGTALKQSQVQSPLANQTVVRPKGTSSKRLLVSSLMLTSLVDAFSILVIFLLMSAKSGIEELDLKKVNEIPQAQMMDAPSKGIILRLEADGGFFIDDEQVSEKQLAAKLEEAKTKFESGLLNGDKASLIVQADKKMDFEKVSPILRAGAEAGLNKFRFAVMEKTR